MDNPYTEPLCKTDIIHRTVEVLDAEHDKAAATQVLHMLNNKACLLLPSLHWLPLLAYNLNAESTNNGEVSAAGWGQF